MNSPRSKLKDITSATLRYADNKEKSVFRYIPPANSGEFKCKAARRLTGWQVLIDISER